VLIDGAAMPRGDELPDPLKLLTRRHAVQLRYDRFGADGGSLARALKEALGGPAPVPRAGSDLASRVRPGSGESFGDFTGGPEMVVVPAGEFRMGTAAGETAALVKEYGDEFAEYFRRENPRHKVVIPRGYAVGKFAVTRGEFSEFVNATGHKVPDEAYVWDGSKWELTKGRSFRNPGFSQDDNHPVVCVSWDDAQAYVKWLKAKTGKTYRLLSEAEWEYAARAGTAMPFWWGSSISTDRANDCNYIFGGGSKSEYGQKTVAVDSFKANPWGLHQVHGNVWEWVEDCWNGSYKDKPPALL
jgi:formylglycine-generating enzyme required for sulfatase activity